MEIQRIDSSSVSHMDDDGAAHRDKRRDPFAGSAFEGSASQADLSGLAEEERNQELDRAVEMLYPAPEPILFRLPSGIRAQTDALSDAHRRALVQSISHLTDPERARYEQKQIELGRMLVKLIGAQIEAEKDEKDRLPGIPDPDELLHSNAMRQAVVDPFLEGFLGETQRSHEERTKASLIGGMWGFEQAIREYVMKIDREQKMSDEIHADMAELQELLNEWTNPEQTQEFAYHEIVVKDDGTKELVQRTVMLDYEAAQNLYRQLEDNDRQLATFGPAEQQVIQVVTHGWQQAMSTLSNVMKQYDETLRNTIQNSKA